MRQINCFHSWDVSPQEAIQIQNEIRAKVIRHGRLGRVRFVAGADVAFDNPSQTAFAGVVILELPELRIVETRVERSPITFPYIPGLLSFRETPPLLKVFSKIRHEPEVIFIDGHGWSHPRSAGLACHIGILLNRPVIGCAKSVLVGSYEIPAAKRSSVSNLYNAAGHVIGAVLRTRAHVKPVFISTGHRVGLKEAIRLTLACGKGYRIPEPTRQADLLVEKAKRETLQG